MKLYTIEFGKYYEVNGIIHQECTNQPAFLNQNDANDEIEYYMKNYFVGAYLGEIPDKTISGYYLEVYEDDIKLSKKEIYEINETHCYHLDGGSNLIKSLIIRFY